ncbi:origin recognition complex subunit 3 N-terminus-domain-containing protein, partial [Vararia minispora EC-137]
DLPDGPSLRLDAYHAVWTACLKRMKRVIRAIHAPLARSIVHDIQHAYDAPLPALPYPEIPVFAVCGTSSGEEFILDIASRLEDDNDDDSDYNDNDRPTNGDENQRGVRLARVVHLRPSECANIMSTMKALISGFANFCPQSAHALAPVRRKPTTSLAVFDIQLLRVWYEALRTSIDEDGSSFRDLVVFMHDFEQYDPAVIADMYHICSAHVPEIPLVFVLVLSSPPMPSFIHQAYRRSTLALLRLQIVSLPRGPSVLQHIILDTFFAFDFEPLVMPGSSTMDFIADFFARHASSLDGIYTILKLAYMHHFEEPLSLLAHPPQNFKKRVASRDAVPFLTALLARAASTHHEPRNLSKPEGLLTVIEAAHEDFTAGLRLLTVALRLLLRVRAFLVEAGQLVEDGSVPTLFGPALRGDLSEETEFLAKELRKSSPETIAGLREDLLAFAQSIPKKDGAVIHDEVAVLGGGANALSKWLFKYCEESIVDLSLEPLADSWFMGATPFPSELINPAPRSTIIVGLADPYAFVEGTGADVDRPRRALWEMPDTSILFRRYLEAGRMVNVYDWYESFALVLDRQREQVRAREAAEKSDNGKGNGRGDKVKGDEKAAEEDEREEDGGEEEDEDNDEERWKMHVQARFMCALHELDFLGFVKHTGRKADHVIRTVYDGAD